MSCDIMTSPQSNIIRVKLLKQPRYGLGFLIRQRSKSPHVIVSDLVSGGMAAESGLVQIGDIVLKVNDTNLMEMNYEDSVKLLKALPINSLVVLILKGPEGYTSHLETRFTNNGTPRTIRITKPILSPETFIDRIKKTFINSTSPKRCQSKQTQANCDCISNDAIASENDTIMTSITGNPENKSMKNGNHLLETKKPNDKMKNGKPPGPRLSSKDNYLETNNNPEPVNEIKTSSKVSTINKTSMSNSLENSYCAEDKTNNILSLKSKVDVNKIKTNDVQIIRKSELNRSCVSNDENCKVQLGDRSGGVSMAFRDQECSGSAYKTSVNISVENESNVGHLMDGNVSGEIHSEMDEHMVNGKDCGKNCLSVSRSESATSRKGSLKKYVKLRNVGDERPVCTDTLHQKASEVSA